MNPDLELLQPYPFEKLRVLLEGIDPAKHSAISLSVGEPKHSAPQVALDAFSGALKKLENYPTTRGSDTWRETVAAWLSRRFNIPLSDRLYQSQVIPVNGTREGLFAIAQCVLDRHARQRTVLMPNPFYQIYEGATLLAGCAPDFYTIDEHADANLNRISDARLNNCQMIYLCTPGNPTGQVNSIQALQQLIEKAHQHDFVIVSDECYSEIYRQDVSAPCGLLQAAQSMGNDTFSRCVAFHSLSKRSNLPGLRSGFVAGDAAIIERFTHYRTYHGCSMSGAVQEASIAAWSDEAHVAENRQAYDQKYKAVLDILSPVLTITRPPAGFYLWPQLPLDDHLMTQRLLSEYNVRVVPGTYLARETSDTPNPGHNRIRLALVAPLEQCQVAAQRIADSLTQGY